MAIEIKFGSFIFSGNYNVDAPKINNPNRLVANEIPQRDGAIIEAPKLKPLIVSFAGNIIGTDAAALQTNLDAFLLALRNGEQNLYIYDNRYIPARMSGFDYEYLNQLCIMFDLTFIAGKPFFFATSLSTDEEIISASPTTYNVSIIGKAPARPVITFAANQGNAITSIAFENTTTGKNFAFTDTVASGKSLIIDCDEDALTVKNDGVDALSDFTGAFFDLINGTNALKYTGQNCTITIDWRDRYYS